MGRTGGRADAAEYGSLDGVNCCRLGRTGRTGAYWVELGEA